MVMMEVMIWSEIILIMYPNYQPGRPVEQPRPYQVHNGSQVPQFYNNQLQPQQPPSYVEQNYSNNNRSVFSSMMQQPTNSGFGSKPSGFGKLESMGRTIHQQPDPVVRVNEPPNQHNMQQPNSLNFRNGQGERPKMSASVIFPKANGDELNRFPTFNNETNFGTSRLEALMGKKPVQQMQHAQEQTQESLQTKRKKEIESIKEELNKLNKRMENVTLKKNEGGTGEQKPYFQLPTRKNNPANNQPLANTYPPPNEEGNSNFFKSYSGSSTNSSFSVHQSIGAKQEQAPQYSSYSQSSQSNQYSQPSQQSFQYSQPQQQYTQSPQNLQINQYSSYSQQSHPPINPSSQNSQYLNVNSLQKPQSLQHSLSANELGGGPFSKREQPGGMFKKKNPYVLDEGLRTQEPAAKTLLLSPRANMSKQPEPAIVATTEYKAAEVVEIPQPKKGMRRIESFSTESEKILQKIEQSPKQFKKSDFAIGKKMGKGQFGEVMLVQHKKTGFLCGLKVMSKKQIREQKYENQVARELAIQFYLAHRNIAPLYGYFSDEENVYLLIEYCTGGQLLQLLRKAHRMQEADCSPIIRQICEGLDFIHKEQIIHRDIKPQNILFNFNTVKICDFGWAVYSGNGMRKTVAGSPLYYSPQVVLQTKYDEKIDIWAIGMMTYECLLGKIPFRIYSQLDLNRIVQDQIKFPEYIDVSDQAKDFILKICKKNPDDRMEMRDIMRHPFITKYIKDKKVGNQIIQEFRKIIN